MRDVDSMTLHELIKLLSNLWRPLIAVVPRPFVRKEFTIRSTRQSSADNVFSTGPDSPSEPIVPQNSLVRARCESTSGGIEDKVTFAIREKILDCP